MMGQETIMYQRYSVVPMDTRFECVYRTTLEGAKALALVYLAHGAQNVVILRDGNVAQEWSV